MPRTKDMAQFLQKRLSVHLGATPTLSQAVYIFALVLASCLCRASRSARGRNFSGLFWAGTQHVCGLLDSQGCVRAPESPYFLSVSFLAFPLKLLVSLLFGPAVSPLCQAAVAKTFAYECFWSGPLSAGGVLRQDRARVFEPVFQGPPGHNKE